MFKSFLALLLFCCAPLFAAEPLQSIYTNLENNPIIRVSDIDADGDLDLLVGSRVFYQQADGHFDGPYLSTYLIKNNFHPLNAGIRNEQETPNFYGIRNINSTFPTLLSLSYSEPRKVFTQTSQTPLAPRTFSHQITDLDQDGYLDFITETTLDSNTTPYPTSKLTVSWGNTLNHPEITIADFLENDDLSSFLHSVDLNGNGLLDILFDGTIHSGSRGLYVIRQSSNRTFDTPEELYHSDNSRVKHEDWKVGDLNGDGKTDLFYCTYNNDQSGSFTYSLQTSDGKFDPSVTSALTYPPNPKIVIDSSAGNHATIHYITHTETTPLSLVSFVFDQPANATITEIESTLIQAPNDLAPNQSAPLIYRDINQDGFNDLILTVLWKVPSPYRYGSFAGAPQLCIGYGTADGSFNFLWEGDAPLTNSLQAKGNFNEDKLPDLIIGATPTGQVTLITNGQDHNQGYGWIRQRELTELLPPNFQNLSIRINSITAIDINQDGFTDLHVHLRKPKPNTSTSPFDQISGSSITTHKGSSHTDDDYTYCFLIAVNDGHGHFTYKHPLPSGFLDGSINQKYPIFAYADWDNDGDLDAIADAFGWYQNNDGAFSYDLHFLISPMTIPDALGTPDSMSGLVTIADIDGDGALDLAVPIAARGEMITAGYPGLGGPTYKSRLGIVFGNGTGGISKVITYPISLHGTDALGNPLHSRCSFLDLNDDGLMDIVYDETLTDALGNPFNTPHISYNSPDGRFGTLNAFSAINGFHGLKPADYNGDGVIDLCSPQGFTRGSPYGPSMSPEYQLLPADLGYSNFSADAFIDIDNDHDADFLFKPASENTGLLSLKNPLVDGDDPTVRHALNSGLMATDTHPDADPDQDGLSNLVEYMFGGIPSAPDSASILPRLGTDFQSGSPRLTASFKQRAQLPAGKQYHLQISDDLQNWIDYPLSGGSVTPIDSTWQQFNISIDPSSYFPDGNNAFIQWSVE